MSKSRRSIIPGSSVGVKVLGPKREDVEYALRIFKRKFKDSGKVDELKDRKTYKKPSEVKRKIKQDAIRKQQLSDLKNN